MWFDYYKKKMDNKLNSSILDNIEQSLYSLSFNSIEVNEVMDLISTIQSKKVKKIEETLDHNDNIDTNENEVENNPFGLSVSPPLFDIVEHTIKEETPSKKNTTNKIVVYVNKRRVTLTKDQNCQWSLAPIVQETNSEGSTQFFEQRLEILNRIISSETEYISKLFSLCKTYKDRLANGFLSFDKKKTKTVKPLKPLSVVNLFANIEQIWKLHNTIVKEIFTLKKKPQYSLVGTLFWNLVKK